MVRNRNRILNRSYVGECSSYFPDTTRPRGVKARDVEGLDVYECLNCVPTDEGEKITQPCGKRYCENFRKKKR